MKTNVVFRVYKNGNVIALFPDIDEGRGLCSSYIKMGQHSSASYVWIIQQTKPATEKQYGELFKELTHIGYNLNVQQRRTRR